MATAPKTKNKKTEPKSVDETLKRVTDDFQASWDYASGSWHERWENNHSLYNNVRVNRGYEGITDTFVPMSFSTVETLTSALYGTKPSFDYLPPRNNPDQKTDILNALLDFFWDKDQWSVKVINTGRGTLKLGTAVDYFYWAYDHPCMINVPIRDFFIDPTATNIENARYMGRRYLTTIDELKTFEVVDPETGEMKPKYKNLGNVEPGGKTNEPTDKENKDMFYGSTVTEPEKRQVEVIEWWTEDRVISVANRTIVIEDAENYFKAKARANGDEHPKGLMPFASSRDYVDESLFYAKGELDFIGDEQELLNDFTNQYSDAISYSTNQMYTLDPKYADKINEVENLPGAVYPFEKDALSPIRMGNIPPDIFNQIQNIKNEMRETTASNEVIKGVGAEGAKTTATEINAQIAGAGQRINLKVTQIENEYFHRMARIVFAMIRLYVTEPMLVRILGKDGARWETFDPAEFADGDYEPRVQLDITVENRKREEAADAKELLAAFLGDPDVNQQELKKMVLAKSFDLDPDEVETLMQPQAPMGMPEGMEEGLPPEMGGIDPMSGLPMEGMPPEMAMEPPMQFDPNLADLGMEVPVI